MRKQLLSTGFLTIMLILTCFCFSEAGESPVTNSHLIMIDSLFRDNGLSGAIVRLDRFGRAQLGGSYKDSREVSLAFSLAQSVVGVKWTSPVTPENVKVREWAENLSALFPTKKKVSTQLERQPARDGVKEKYAMVVGVSRFKNDKDGKNALKYAARDAQEVYDYLVDRNYGRFKKDKVTLLINENATIGNIQQALDRIKEKADSDDDVFVYFSSHGAPVYDGSLNIVTYETVFKNHFTMADSSFPSKSLKTFLGETKAGDILVILDVCYSGAAFKGIDGFYYAGSKSISFDDDNQGLSKAVLAKNLLGSKDIMFEDDVAKTPEAKSIDGAKVIISASDAGEKSWESDSLKASFFTHYFLQELRRGADVKTAFAEAKPKVTTQVRQEKQADQNPQVIASKKDWGVKIAQW